MSVSGVRDSQTVRPCQPSPTGSIGQSTRGGCHLAVEWTLLLLLLAASTACAQRHRPNLAAGKPYELSPPPNYARCTDEADRFQLTDGRKNGCNWRAITTVGWRDADTLPTVIVDLGSVQPISEIRVHTVGGGFAGVYHPAAMLVMVSDDGEAYFPVALVDETKPELRPTIARGGRPYVLLEAGLATRGRYVQVVLVPHKRYVFLDELEVLDGPHDPKDVSFPIADPVRSSDAPAILKTAATAKRLRRDVDELAARVGKEGRSDLVEACHALRSEAVFASLFDLSAWGKIERQYKQLRGRFLSANNDQRLSWRQVNPFAPWNPEASLDFGTTPSDGVVMESWLGEYESGAVELLNASDETMKVNVSVSPVRSPDGRDLVDLLTVRRSVVVESRDGTKVGDPLVKLVDRSLTIEPGGLARLWLTGRPVTSVAGEYRFVIRLAPDSGNAVQIPGLWRVYPLQFPAKPTLHTVTWAYPEKLGLGRVGKAAVIRDLERHYGQEYVVPASSCPKAFMGADGSMTVDFRAMKKAIALNPNARTYLFFWAMKPRRLDSLGKLGHWMTPQWQANMRQLLDRWVRELQSMGIGYDRFMMYPFDENLGDKFFALATLIKEHDPNIRIFANSAGDRRGDRFARFMGLIDVWCFPEDRTESTLVRRLLANREGHQVWRYATRTDAKTLSPYSYYRLMPWRSFAAGDTGCGFWTYAGRRKAGACCGWDDATCSIDRWSVVYLGDGAPVDCSGEVVVPSVRWEAWRAGIEDFEYLTTLRSAIEASERGTDTPALAAHARSVLLDAVRNVLADDTDATRADAERIRLTKVISTLRAAVAGE